MANILDRIVESKRREIIEAKKRVLLAELEHRVADAPPVRDFRAALEQCRDEVAVIAEVKKASPSAGVIRESCDPVQLAHTYEAHGAACISVLTDQPFFQGNLDYLSAIRRAVSLPLLRKDFLLEPYQVVEARAAGADAVLLIAEILDDDALRSLLTEAQRLEMHALVELYDANNLTRVIDSGARLIGINNRNLTTFETKLEHTLELIDKMPKDACVVSESGIRTVADVERLRQAGARAILVGETLMRSPDVGAKLMELRGQALDH